MRVGRKSLRMVRAAASGVTSGPGFAMRNLARDRGSFAAYSNACLAASRYFSAWIGDKNKVSAALSKPSPPAPSAGNPPPTSTWRLRRSRNVAEYCARLSRRIGARPGEIPAEQASARRFSCAQLTIASLLSRLGAGAPLGGISPARTRIRKAFHASGFSRKLAAVFNAATLNPPAGALPM